MRNFFARTIRGLEWLAAAEVSSLPEANIKQIHHRLLRFETDASSSELLRLGCVDDVFHEFAQVRGIDQTRGSIPKFKLLPLAMKQGFHFKQTTFDVVASFTRRRNYTRFDIEDEVGVALKERFGGQYMPRRAGPVSDTDQSWRVHLFDDYAVLGLRLPSAPLHRRGYRKATHRGSLHPPVAYAMALLLDAASDSLILDPCCGSGTLLIEAKALTPSINVVACDINPERVTTALNNARMAKVNMHIIAADAGRLPFPSGLINSCITNLPWGTQIAPAGLLADGRANFLTEIKRVLAPNGRIIVLTDDRIPSEELMIPGLKERFFQAISISGKWAFIQLLIHIDEDFCELWHHNRKLSAAMSQWHVLRKRIELHITEGQILDKL